MFKLRIMIMLICYLSAFSVFSQESRFYRVSSTHETMIMDFDSTGFMTWTNSASNTPAQVESTTNLVDGVWTQALVHAVVANLDSATTVLVSTTSTNPPADILRQPHLWADANQTIESPPLLYQLTIFAYRDYFPPSTSGLIVSADITEMTSGTIPSSLHITGISVIHYYGSWTPLVPTERRTTSSIGIVVYDGPFWEPGEFVEVRVIIQDDETKYLLKTTGVIADVY